jgi:hypothetical protein
VLGKRITPTNPKSVPPPPNPPKEKLKCRENSVTQRKELSSKNVGVASRFSYAGYPSLSSAISGQASRGQLATPPKVPTRKQSLLEMQKKTPFISCENLTMVAERDRNGGESHKGTVDENRLVTNLYSE